MLGGLLEDSLRESDQRVPILGSLPLLGNLFRARTTDTVKTNLLVFIRPRIVRDSVAAALETNSKYNYIRDLQLNRGEDAALMRGVDRPILPPLEEFRESGTGIGDSDIPLDVQQ